MSDPLLRNALRAWDALTSQWKRVEWFNGRAKVQDQHEQPLTRDQLDSAPVEVSGSFNISVNLPDVYPLPTSQILDLKEVSASQSGSWTVNVGNFPNNFPLPTVQIDSLKNIRNLDKNSDEVTVFQGSQWTCAITNFPTTFPLSENQISEIQQIRELSPLQDSVGAVQIGSWVTEIAGTVTVEQSNAPWNVVKPENGNFDYVAGIEGTVSLVGKIVQISCTAGSSGGTVVINGGNEISLEPDQPFNTTTYGNLVDANIVFTNTVNYYVQVAI